MQTQYQVRDGSRIPSPALVIFRPLVLANLRRLVAIAGDVERLRPHCKTHKMPAVTELQRELGIAKGKCATIAEAEMLAKAGLTDIVLAYNIVGPNIERVVRFCRQFPDVRFGVTADDPRPLVELATALDAAECEVDVLLDIDTGQGRTGLPVGPAAAELYQQIDRLRGVRAGGFHVYDGQNHQTDVSERRAAVARIWDAVSAFRDEQTVRGIDVPRIVAGGTGTFPCFAAIDDPALELSPGTSVFHDAGYRDTFPDLEFDIAALLLTRVVSVPGIDRVTCDLGYKAVAADPPAGERVEFPDIPDALAVLQNEEHLVLQTSSASEFAPGDLLWAIPRHICPTSALHQFAWVVDHGEIVGQWSVTGRDRCLSI